MTDSLLMPEEFNPETHMLGRIVDGIMFHGVIPTIRFASDLVTSGTPQDLQQAEDTIRAVLGCQERREDDPHYGNFWWEREDEFVEDLNAVQFVLFNLIPIMVQYRDRLSSDLQQEILTSIRLGLDEIRRIDVHPAYTNIVLKDITNTCLGGELLNNPDIANRGYEKLLRWMQLTNQNGIPIEFNSPNYARIAITVLNMLATLTRHKETQIRATVMRNRLALSTVLHIHRATGRLAGPYSRAYLPSVFAQTPPDIHDVQDWIKTGIVPEWLETVLNHQPDTMQVTETADAEAGVGISTYHSPSFVLGVASKELTTQSNRFIALQSNVCIAQYVVPDQERTGVFFTRYLHNDRWVGDYYSTPSRSSNFLLPEEGRFFGVQDGQRMIGMYAPRELNGWDRCHSAKAVMVWLHQDLVDEIWVDDRRIDALPTSIKPGQTVVVGSGQVYFAVRPLTITDMGRNAPMQLTTKEDHLVLELYNYRGPAKTFWEMANPGSFYQGQPQCGFYVEMAERTDYSNGSEFARVVASGSITDEVQPPVTYEKGVERLWRAEYARDGQRIGLEVELMEWQLKQRWTQAGVLKWHMLESPIARQTKNGTVTIGEATLTCGQTAAWLLALPEQNLWVATYHGKASTPLTLTLPIGKVEITAMGAGTIVWHNGQVTVNATDLTEPPQITGGKHV